jgi:nucleotide-binding universal stress UspA family protein
MPYRSILCPVDLSAESRSALACAVGLAARDRARLTVLSVNVPLLVEAASALQGAEAVQRESESELVEFVHGVLPPDASWRVDARSVVRVGEPARVIIEEAGREAADLIVMGTRGLGGYQKLFSGSVTEAVLNRAPVSVLAVPGEACRLVQLRADGPLVAAGRVLAPISLSPGSEHAAARAAEIARELGATLLLLHVVDPIAAPSRWREAAQAHQRIRIAHARDRLERIAAGVARDLVVDVRLAEGRPGDEIAAAAAEARAALIAMGLEGRGGVLGAKPASTAYRVVCLAQVPVLAFRREDPTPAA